MRFERTVTTLFLALAVVLIAFQLRSIFVFPQPNSFRWFGDETWLMSEAHEQITTGVVRYPLAIGSTLEHEKGVVLGMPWLSSVLYGVPVLLSDAPAVETGRVVTAALAVFLSLLLYSFARKLGAIPVAASLSVLLLSGTRSFFYASHSARPDLLAGVIVLLFVASMSLFLRSDRNRSWRWWFAYGTIVMVLAVTSSIHLLTLLGPVALYFLLIASPRRGINILAAGIGALALGALLVSIYYITTGNFTLFPASAGPAQFQDVLSSIPIDRPFSRSVQVANLIIRVKQFWAEAPAIFLLPLAIPFLGLRYVPSRKILAIAIGIVFLSWLLLEGAEINYLVHVLPLLFLALALMISKIWSRSKMARPFLIALGLMGFIFGIRDSSTAYDTASQWARSNRHAVSVVESSIGAEKHSPAKPRTVTEPVTLAGLSQDTNIAIMTDHFISFPTVRELSESFFHREHVNFVVLYNSPVYPKDRSRDDSFYKAVEQSGRRIATIVGMAGDMGRDYFGHSNWQDTVILFQIAE